MTRDRHPSYPTWPETRLIASCPRGDCTGQIDRERDRFVVRRQSFGDGLAPSPSARRDPPDEVPFDEWKCPVCELNSPGHELDFKPADEVGQQLLDLARRHPTAEAPIAEKWTADITSAGELIKRYQKCVSRILSLFYEDLLPDGCAAQAYVERLEALLDYELIVPRPGMRYTAQCSTCGRSPLGPRCPTKCDENH